MRLRKHKPKKPGFDDLTDYESMFNIVHPWLRVQVAALAEGKSAEYAITMAAEAQRIFGTRVRTPDSVRELAQWVEDRLRYGGPFDGAP